MDAAERVGGIGKSARSGAARGGSASGAGRGSASGSASGSVSGSVSGSASLGSSAAAASAPGALEGALDSLDRRGFLKGAAAAAAGAAAAVAVASSGALAQAGVAGPAAVRTAQAQGSAEDEALVADADGLAPDISTDKTYVPHVGELPTPRIAAPEQTDYASDVLVVGGGLAGINAAFAAREQGMSVVLVDKGYPGYSGLSPWARCHAYHDPDRDNNDPEFWDRYMLLNCHCFANLDWEDVWRSESKQAYERLASWGYFARYPRGYDTEYWKDGFAEHDDGKGYFQNVVGENDRHLMYQRVLDENGVVTVPQTMIVDILQDDDGRTVGAMGLHYKSATVMRFTAKAVVLCTGSGIIKATGYPLGADTFDGAYIGYQHGLPLTGYEFEDFHSTLAYAPDNVYAQDYWHYLENAWAQGGFVTEENMLKKQGVDNRYSTFGTGRGPVNNMKVGAPTGTNWSLAVEAGDADDPRLGKFTSPSSGDTVPAGAVGFCTHTCSGIWCGVDDLEGYTGIPGLWCAGDGTNGCYVGGPNYACLNGSTTNFVSIQGYRAGGAAAAYASGAPEAELPADKAAELEERILAPLNLEKGYDPNWARETLYNIMAPGWVCLVKTEESLTNALQSVERLRDLVSGKLRADNGHEARLAHEVEHQLLAMELKLRAGIERRESRGYHYRKDYPFHDDDYLYYITWTRGDDGTPQMGRAELKDRWKGDLSADYYSRYPLLNTPEEWEKYGSLVPEKKQSTANGAATTSNTPALCGQIVDIAKIDAYVAAHAKK